MVKILFEFRFILSFLKIKETFPPVAGFKKVLIFFVVADFRVTLNIF